MMKAKGFLFDVDGVLVDSPHEVAWGNTLQRLLQTHWKGLAGKISYSPEKYTPEVYQKYIAGKPRRDGGAALLHYFDIPDPDGRLLDELCEAKQAMLVDLIERGQFRVFDDAIRFVLRVKEVGARLAAASSSKNANRMLEQIRLDQFCEVHRLTYPFVKPGFRLIAIFDVNVCGWDFKQGKPHPEIFLTAAHLMSLTPAECIVIEDAPVGVQAAKAAGMACIGVARRQDAELLKTAGADWVIETLDEIGRSDPTQ